MNIAALEQSWAWGRPCQALSPGWSGQGVGVRGMEAVEGSVTMNKVCEVGGGQVVDGFLNEQKEFELNLFESDVVTGTGLSEQQSSKCTGVYLEDTP